MESKASKAAKLAASGPGPSKGQLAQRAKKLLEKKKKRKPKTSFQQYYLRDGEQFALCDAIRYAIVLSRGLPVLTLCRYIRAVEVGRKPTSVKYEIAIKLKTQKNGPVLRNRIRLPYPVKTDVRVCVICPPDSKYAEAARAAGAVLVGEDEIFEAIKEKRIDFDRCICQTDSYAKLNKAQLGRILGPKGLMPSPKLGTVVKDPSVLVKDFIGGAEYKERMGVVRMAVGQLGSTPEQISRNIKTFMEAVKKDIGQFSDRISKEVAEVVLSSTNGPGFSLNGEFRDLKSDVQSRDLATS
jgi:large subunit ribosomal protein L1